MVARGSVRQLSLRTRLLLGIGLVVVVQVIAAAALISVTSDQLLDQIDERLAAASASVSANGFADDGLDGVEGNLDGLADVYQGSLNSDGTLETLNSVVDRRGTVPPPEIGPTGIETALIRPITVEAERGEVEYRVVAVASDGGDTLVLASPLDGFEWTINRLTRLVAIAAAVVMLVLGAVTWWVLHLGIRPIKQMTSTAEAIAAGDLSERIEPADPATEAGQLGLALNSMMGRIESSFEQRTGAEARLRQFVADASHELRTPVATIRGYAELYQAGGLEQQADLDDAMRRTGQESERMSRLIADMLSLAKLDREPTVRTEEVDLSAVAREVVADARATHDDRVFSLNLGPGPAVVAGDEDLLRQALANLVSNAVVHANRDATTTVTVGGDSTQVTVMVSDNGDGMAQEVVDRATERFFRADPSRSRHRGGSGLGLAIVSSVVAVHRGDLKIDSTPGDGTTVTITVPVFVDPAALS